jgi:hypothetical protein
MLVLLNKCTTQIGLPIPISYQKRIRNGGCVLIILILKRHVKKDPFRLPWIDQVVDSTAGCSLLSFLSCYSGYHQIPLKVEDQINTSCMTLFSAFCYTTIPFRPKSVGATYQMGIQLCLYSQLRRNAKAYVHDVVVKLGKKRDSSLKWQRPSTTKGNSK